MCFHRELWARWVGYSYAELLLALPPASTNAASGDYYTRQTHIRNGLDGCHNNKPCGGVNKKQLLPGPAVFRQLCAENKWISIRVTILHDYSNACRGNKAPLDPT